MEAQINQMPQQQNMNRGFGGVGPQGWGGTQDTGVSRDGGGDWRERRNETTSQRAARLGITMTSRERATLEDARQAQGRTAANSRAGSLGGYKGAGRVGKTGYTTGPALAPVGSAGGKSLQETLEFISGQLGRALTPEEIAQVNSQYSIEAGKLVPAHDQGRAFVGPESGKRADEFTGWQQASGGETNFADPSNPTGGYTSASTPVADALPVSSPSTTAAATIGATAQTAGGGDGRGNPAGGQPAGTGTQAGTGAAPGTGAGTGTTTQGNPLGGGGNIPTVTSPQGGGTGGVGQTRTVTQSQTQDENLSPRIGGRSMDAGSSSMQGAAGRQGDRASPRGGRPTYAPTRMAWGPGAFTNPGANLAFGRRGAGGKTRAQRLRVSVA